MPAFVPGDISVALPTYERGDVLVATVAALVRQPAGEILLIDQTLRHPPAVADALDQLARDPRVRRVKLPQPAIPPAMNAALREATRPVVLFLDDDIEPGADLVGAHARAYDDDAIWAVAGQVLQPGELPAPPRPFASTGFRAFLDFPFWSNQSARIQNGMAGNLSVRRARALAIGGFDENFEGVAYRFETEFCRRLCRAGGRIAFEPEASIHHLRAPRGGTRAAGSHLTSASPRYGVGDYYFALREPGGLARWWYVLRRPWREVMTRFHLRHPWYIPIKLLGELRALVRGLTLARRKPLLRP